LYDKPLTKKAESDQHIMREYWNYSNSKFTWQLLTFSNYAHQVCVNRWTRVLHYAHVEHFWKLISVQLLGTTCSSYKSLDSWTLLLQVLCIAINVTPTVLISSQIAKHTVKIKYLSFWPNFICLLFSCVRKMFK
jgi:hypothetical protein